MSAFGDMMLDDLPEPVPLAGDERGNGRAVERQGGGGQLEVRTINGNMGAIRVAVPRDLARVNQLVAQFAAISGDAWTYRLPFKRKDRRTGRMVEQVVEGPTVKCALDIARAYGNCVVDCPEIEDVGSAWVFHGRFLDIETGFQVQRPFRQRKAQNVGGYGGDQGRAEDVVFQIGASKAMRNAVVNALPTIVDRGRALAKRSIREWIANNVPKAVARIRDMLDEAGIAEARVERFYARSLDALTPSELTEVIGQLKAVEEGYADAAEVFPAPEAERPAAAQGSPPERAAEARDNGEPPVPGSAQEAPPAPGEPEEGEPGEADPEDVREADAAIDRLPTIRSQAVLLAERQNNRQLLERLRYAGHPKAGELDDAFNRRDAELGKGRRG
jgi:hypothetical protein